MSAAAVVVIKEKELMAHFREWGALSPAAALSTNALGVAENDTFRRLCAHAVIREAAPGVFYLDETAARAAVPNAPRGPDADRGRRRAGHRDAGGRARRFAVVADGITFGNATQQASSYRAPVCRDKRHTARGVRLRAAARAVGWLGSAINVVMATPRVEPMVPVRLQRSVCGATRMGM